jgi:hypothetical protein
MLKNLSLFKSIPLTRPLQQMVHQQKSYAVVSVHNKPEITKGDELSQTNNPVTKTIAMVRGEPKVVYTRHPEFSMSLCQFPGCNKKVCSGFCAKPSETKSQVIGHATHGNHEKAQPFYEKDLQDNDKKENIVVYKKPHEVSSEVNEQKTETFYKGPRSSILEKILKDTHKNDD